MAGHVIMMAIYGSSDEEKDTYLRRQQACAENTFSSTSA